MTIRFAVLVAIAQLSASVPALARKRAVVLPFVGPHSAATRQSVSRALGRRVGLLSLPKYRQTAERLKVEIDSADGIMQACGQLRCDAAVAGRVRRRGKVRYQLTVTVVSGHDGSVVGSVRARARGRRGLYRAAKTLARQVAALIGRLRQRPRVGPQAPAVDQRSPAVDQQSPVEVPATEEDEAPDWETPQDEVVDGAEKPLPGTPEAPPLVTQDPVPRAKPVEEAGPALHGVFDVYAAAGVSTRSYNLTGPPAQRRYEPVLFSEFTLGGEFYPAALFSSGFLRYFGAAISYTHHIAVSTQLPSASQLTTCTFDDDVSTSSQELLVDLKMRWPLPMVLKPELSASVGYGQRDFALGRNNVLPSLNYQFARIGLAARVPLGTPLVAADVGADVRPLFRVGQQAIDSFGPRTNGLGWAIRAGLSGRHRSGLIYFATFEYLGFSMGFEGLDPQTSPERDCFPDEVRRSDGAAFYGSDTFVRFWLGAGYAM